MNFSVGKQRRAQALDCSSRNQWQLRHQARKGPSTLTRLLA